ncbi:MAG: hypothetical protein AB7E70_20400 [Hyphomicrobiaceae bacterium]
MRIDLAERDGTHLRYFLYDDAGNELRQVNRDCAREIEIASKQKRSLADVLLERESGERTKKQRRTALAPDRAAPVATNHTHEEFGWPVAEHEHPDLAPREHEHPHSHDEIGDVDTKVTLLSNHVGETFKRLQGNLDGHGHFELARLNHGHPDLDAHLIQLDRLLRALQAAPAPEHTHPELVTLSVLQALVDRVTALEAETRALHGLLNGHGHPLPEHTHEGIAHDHPSLQRALDEHIEASKRVTSARVLSRQEVNGTQRLVLEELS